ncbi:MAG TPA: phosphatidylserine decarboxylase [Roseiflexaceae bacterium]
MTLQEKVYFLRQLQSSFTSIGALIPTSRYAARMMASECARRADPRTILEVGPGTGSITAEIVRAMRPGDRLTLVELNADFVAYLRERFEREPDFQRVRDQVTVLHMDITQLDATQRFDYIISAVPFNNLPPELVEAILDRYRTLLAPDGVLTYIEYAYLRAIKQRLLTGEEREQFGAVNRVLDRYIERYQFRRDFELRNVPPAWARHLRFQQPPAEAALELAPLEHNHRIALGASGGISTEALPWLVGLLLAALFVRPLRRLHALLWLAATAIAAFFRDPHRQVVANPDVAYAACDGRVLSVERVRDERFGDEEWLRVAVFLSLVDTHINRSPVAGKVVETIRETGGFAAADSADAEHNNALYTLIEGAHGRCIVAQRAGLVARRIVNWTNPGELLAQGERYGLICFGSRTDVYLPANRFEACVAVGEIVRGGETVIARHR